VESMKIFFFHLMPWPYLDPDFDKTYGTAWVKLPNKLYDPEKGNKLYNRYLDELESAEALGFDGICVNEHHQSAYGQMPSPNIMAASLVRRTKNVKIAILGNALPLYEFPLRVAEEIAMLDVISGGRIISGFVRGIGAEYHTFPINPTESRDRFNEAFDLIQRAWTSKEIFNFSGKYYSANYVNIWPRPLQNPHPPVWIPSQGSVETIEWSAERKFTYLQTFSPTASLKKYLDMYKEVAETQFGYKAHPEQLGWAVPIYVAETDEKAMNEARPHIEFFFNKLLRMPQEYYFPPGYLTRRSMKMVMESKKGLSEYRSLERLMEEGTVIIGSPATVRDKLKYYHSEIGYGNLVGMFQFSTLSHEQTMKNMHMFASEVMPHIRDL
jgi:alkanesulfonate monooxygenase SsuD/methylene tetrahydromethanopterin reductase-like flavin-dependent oxidoreductase (luciferase family)